MTREQQRIDLTESEYDETVKLYEKTGNIKYRRILQNCRIVIPHISCGYPHTPDDLPIREETE